MYINFIIIIFPVFFDLCNYSRPLPSPARQPLSSPSAGASVLIHFSFPASRFYILPRANHTRLSPSSTSLGSSKKAMHPKTGF